MEEEGEDTVATHTTKKTGIKVCKVLGGIPFRGESCFWRNLILGVILIGVESGFGRNTVFGGIQFQEES